MQQTALNHSAHGGVTREIAAFAAGLTYDDIPSAVREKWVLHVIDALACAAAGARLPIAICARNHALTMGNPQGKAPIIGTGDCTSPMMAAFANAFAANALDFDDGFEHDGKGMGHPGSSLVAAAIAAFGHRAISGCEMLAALVAGAEINNRLILSMQPTAERFQEAYGVGQHQSVGAAIVYARLSGLPPAQFENAIGIAASLTSVPSLHKYNWETRPIISLKDFVAPAAQAGVQAVELTRAGMVGPSSVFDGPHGYWRMIGSDRFNPDILVGRLGSVWRSAEGSFKTYPACRWIAPALEAFERAWTTQTETARISEITVRSFEDVALKMASPHPQNAIDAQFSLPHLLACLAVRLPPGLPWFSKESLSDPALRSIADKVRIETDAEMDAAMRGIERRPSAQVVVKLSNDLLLEEFVALPLGGSARPISHEHIIAKAQWLLSQSEFPKPEAILKRMQEFRSNDDILRDFIELFTNSERIPHGSQS